MLLSKSANPAGQRHDNPQTSAASSAQADVQSPEQQVGSSAQTRSQQASSSQPVPAWTEQQSPLPGQTAGAEQRSPQRSFAALTQSTPQLRKQQNASSLQTAAQQAASLHPEDACSVQQLSGPGHAPVQSEPHTCVA
jgi:hypothetical protein